MNELDLKGWGGGRCVKNYENVGKFPKFSLNFTIETFF